MHIHKEALQTIFAEIWTDILPLQTRLQRLVHVPVNANKYYVLTQIWEHIVLTIQKRQTSKWNWAPVCLFFTAAHILLTKIADA